jgi:hypothetical protein
MPHRIIANRKNLSTTLHFVSNGTVVIAGNSTVSDIAIDNEVLTGAYITQVWYGSPSGSVSYWEIKRGANTVAVLDSTSYTDFAGNGNALKLDSGATLTASLIGTTAGYLMIEVQKEGNFTSEYFQN